MSFSGQPDNRASTLHASRGVMPAALAPGEFNVFYESMLGPLRCYLARMLGNRADAQDIAQDAFVKTFEAVERQPVLKPKAFLFVTARRMALNYRTRRLDRMHPAGMEILDAQPQEQSVAREIEAQEEFDQTVKGLPPGCQQVLCLRYRDGLNHAQIAERLNLAESSVANHISRALRLLRERAAARPAAGDTPNPHRP
jgi:RNA polymerase sigma factor (sigma-70 family)